MTEHKAYSFKVIYKLTIHEVDQSDSGIPLMNNQKCNIHIQVAIRVLPKINLV